MQEFRPGDFVKLIDQDTIAEILQVLPKELEIAIGTMKMKVKRNKVIHAEPPKSQESIWPSISSSGIDTKEKLLHFQKELDVRGKAKEEVFQELGTWVDDAILLGIEEARIVHGRGTGVLKDTVRSFLKKYKEVSSAGDDAKDRGADFVTVVKFKV